MNPQSNPVPALAVEPGFFAGRTVAELQDAMRQGALDAEALVRHAAAAIERLNPQLNAFVHVDADAALAAARALDAERARGQVRGPLHGIPVAIKDNVDTGDMPTTMGAARNPWRTSQITGGSSAGSGAAVAAGMVPVALGTDTGGSVRVPAALCGVVGFKPTHGRVSARGVFPLAPSIEDAGVLANSVEDAQVFMQALSGGAIGAYAEAADPGLAAPRMMWVPNAPFAIEDAAVTARARALAEGFGGVLVDGAEVTRHARALQAALGAIQRSEAYEVHAERVEDEPGKFDPEVLERLRASRPVQGWEYVRARNTRERLRGVFAGIFERVDVLALPAVAITAPALQQRSVAGPGSAAVRETLLGLTNPWNLLGLPAIALPAGFVDGMPVALQLVAAEGADARLLALAARHWRRPGG
ncbi:amidase [Achromobacter xylosoxidans]